MKIKDELGTYEVSSVKRPIDFNDTTQYTYLSLSVFQNKPVRNKNEYSINLSYKIPQSKRFYKFNATMLNTFEPLRWMRNFDKQEQRQKLMNPFYFDWVQERKRILRENSKQNISIQPTAGFFHEVLGGKDFIGDTFLDAYATLHWTKDEYEPRVNIRFFDFTHTSLFLEENQNWELGSQEPRWQELIYVKESEFVKVKK